MSALWLQAGPRMSRVILGLVLGLAGITALLGGLYALAWVKATLKHGIGWV